MLPTVVVINYKGLTWLTGKRVLWLRDKAVVVIAAAAEVLAFHLRKVVHKTKSSEPKLLNHEHCIKFGNSFLHLIRAKSALNHTTPATNHGKNQTQRSYRLNC